MKILDRDKEQVWYIMNEISLETEGRISLRDICAIESILDEYDIYKDKRKSNKKWYWRMTYPLFVFLILLIFISLPICYIFTGKFSIDPKWFLSRIVDSWERQL